MSTRVKICGITRIEDALTAVRLGANAIGFIFWDKSTRYIDPKEARKIVMALPPFVTVVGVYVNPSSEWVEETCSITGLNLLQFHGDELPEFCSQFSLPY
ncbi:MAG: phosphoribosylanthranilate isomerase, partial [Nitrosomonadaceae bacterium]|nr:phosphoribosylanthranilate isomerase [Nitrosomonadaceae bacterium]